MEIGNAIVLAVCLYIAWEALKVGVHFWWQITIQEKRHQAEIAAMRQPTEVSVHGNLETRVQKASLPKELRKP